MLWLINNHYEFPRNELTPLEILESKLFMFEIPVFIKDAIREMARPMITAKTSFGMNSANNNSNIYLPNVNIISGKQYLKLFANNRYKRLINNLMSAMDLRKVYWHHLEIEEIDTLGFSMYHDEKTLYRHLLHCRNLDF